MAIVGTVADQSEVRTLCAVWASAVVEAISARRERRDAHSHRLCQVQGGLHPTDSPQIILQELVTLACGQCKEKRGLERIESGVYE